MQGTIFQVLVLVTHGNAVLSGGTGVAIYPQHSAFKFDEFVKFVDIEQAGSDWVEKPFAANPTDWLAKLKSQKCSGLRVERVSTDKKDLSDRMSVAFVGGGGRWLIEAICPGGSDFWEAGWKVGNKSHPQQKIWQVTYGRIAKHRPTAAARTADLEGLTSSLRQTLQQALGFAQKHELAGFAEAFEAGASELASNSEPELRGLALPGQLPLAASRLLAASQSAWVFGGMGSWNDLGFDGEDQRQYEVISDALFRTINASLVASANLSFTGTERPW